MLEKGNDDWDNDSWELSTGLPKLLKQLNLIVILR